MSVKAAEQWSSHELFVCFHWYMSVVIDVFFAQAKINDEDLLVGAF